MNIIQKTQYLRKRAKQFGRQRFIAERSEVNFQWLAKFIQGRIENPGIENVGKLELFFDQIDADLNHHTQSLPPALASNDAETGAGVSH